MEVCPIYLVYRKNFFDDWQLFLISEVYIMNIKTETGYICKLKVILAESGIKHGWFAERIGVSKGTLSAIVNNKQLPSFEVTYAICLELNRSIHEIWLKKEPTQSE